jgi:hypothetical protein
MSQQESEKYARIARKTNNENVRREALGKWLTASKKEGKSWLLGQPLMLPSGQINGEFLLRFLLLVLFLPIIIALTICKVIPLKGILSILKLPIFIVLLGLEIMLIIFLYYGFTANNFQSALPKTLNFVEGYVSSLRK